MIPKNLLVQSPQKSRSQGTEPSTLGLTLLYRFVKLFQQYSSNILFVRCGNQFHQIYGGALLFGNAFHNELNTYSESNNGIYIVNADLLIIGATLSIVLREVSDYSVFKPV